MKLSDKLEQLRNDIEEYEPYSDEIQDGFQRSIDHAESMEWRLEEREQQIKDIINLIDEMVIKRAKNRDISESNSVIICLEFLKDAIIEITNINSGQ